jgi:hypothetical protein
MEDSDHDAPCIVGFIRRIPKHPRLAIVLALERVECLAPVLVPPGSANARASAPSAGTNGPVPDRRAL